MLLSAYHVLDLLVNKWMHLVMRICFGVYENVHATLQVTDK